METENKEIQEAVEDVTAALADVDPEDTKALYERALQIVDDIHSGRF
jgi:hypothetical protein